MKKKNSILDKAINEAVTRYIGGYTSHGEPKNNNAYIDSYEYLIDSVINGNWSQAKEIASGIDNIDDFVEWFEENGFDDKLRANVSKIVPQLDSEYGWFDDAYEDSLYESKLNEFDGDIEHNGPEASWRLTDDGVQSFDKYGYDISKNEWPKDYKVSHAAYQFGHNKFNTDDTDSSEDRIADNNMINSPEYSSHDFSHDDNDNVFVRRLQQQPENGTIAKFGDRFIIDIPSDKKHNEPWEKNVDKKPMHSKESGNEILRNMNESKLNEGSTNANINNDWYRFVDAFGGNLESFADVMYHYLSTDQIEGLLQYAKQYGYIDDEDDYPETNEMDDAEIYENAMRKMNDAFKMVLNEGIEGFGEEDNACYFDVDATYESVADNIEEFMNTKSYKINDTLELRYFPDNQTFKIEIWDYSTDGDFPETVAHTNCAYTGDAEDDVLHGVYVTLNKYNKH